MTRYYLAGPMRGLDHYGFPAFDKVAAMLRAQGHFVISPAELDRDTGFDETSTDPLPDGFVEGALRRDVAALLEVDAIALLPGWRCSAGATFEWNVATRIGLTDWEVIVVAEGKPWEWVYLDRVGNNRDALDEKPTRPGVTRIQFTPDLDPTTAPRISDVGGFDSSSWDVVTTPADDAEAFKRIVDTNRAAFLDEIEQSATWIEGQWRQLEDTDEVRITSPTGGQKGDKPSRMGQIPPRFEIMLGEVYGRGNEKYPDADTGRPNWSRGYDWSLSYNACRRHLAAFWAGEYLDPDDGLPHLGHAAWHMATLFTFHEEQLGTDDRPAYYQEVAG